MRKIRRRNNSRDASNTMGDVTYLSSSKEKLNRSVDMKKIDSMHNRYKTQESKRLKLKESIDKVNKI